MAGAGYKLFNTGDVLTAAQVNTYLMEQTVMVFADAAARTTALTGVVSEGMISYLKDTNAVEVYNGSAWVASDDPNAIQNTIVDAKGDLISASAADVPARLAVGSNGETLVADSSATTGLRWQALNAAGKNRIINGAMELDQRNSGSSVSATSGGQYFLDRWNVLISAGSKFTVQRNAGSVATPTQFPQYLGVTSSTAWSVGVNDYATLNQMIEGYNVADFGLGTGSPKTFTLSFWVRSSLTGTFGGVISNAITSASATRSYPFTYSISAANTWEFKTITLVGETTAVDWATTNGKGLTVQFSLAAGSNKVTTASAWASGEYFGATGQTNVLATNGATWYVTGVQLELGSVATPFTRAAGTFAGELVACMRYYQRRNSVNNVMVPGFSYNTTLGIGHWLAVVPFRANVTAIDYSNVKWQQYDGADGLVTPAINQNATEMLNLQFTANSGTPYTAGRWGYLWGNGGGYIGLSAEL